MRLFSHDLPKVLPEEFRGSWMGYFPEAALPEKLQFRAIHGNQRPCDCDPENALGPGWR
jgi:hypothetical protein